MKKVFSMMCMTAMFGIAAGASAQSGAMAKDQMDKGMMKDGRMTVSGCVAAGKDAGQFMLTNAMMMGGGMNKEMNKEMMDRDKMQKPGMSDAHMMSYELVGGNNLNAHMGHKIEVMGTMSKMDMDRMAKMDGMTKDKMMSDKDMKAMKLNVASIKMVSATCP